MSISTLRVDVWAIDDDWYSMSREIRMAWHKRRQCQHDLPVWFTAFTTGTSTGFLARWSHFNDTWYFHIKRLPSSSKLHNNYQCLIHFFHDTIPAIIVSQTNAQTYIYMYMYIYKCNYIYIYIQLSYVLQKYTCENKHIVNLAGDQTICTNTQLSHYI